MRILLYIMLTAAGFMTGLIIGENHGFEAGRYIGKLEEKYHIIHLTPIPGEKEEIN